MLYSIRPWEWVKQAELPRAGGPVHWTVSRQIALFRISTRCSSQWLVGSKEKAIGYGGIVEGWNSYFKKVLWSFKTVQIVLSKLCKHLEKYLTRFSVLQTLIFTVHSCWLKIFLNFFIKIMASLTFYPVFNFKKFYNFFKIPHIWLFVCCKYVRFLTFI